MAKTAFELSPQKLKEYKPGQMKKIQSSRESQLLEQNRQQAWILVRKAAELLKKKYGANKVIVFGSLANQVNFTRWSDIDLSAWGIPIDRFYAAVAEVADLSSHIKIDLVDPETCKPVVRDSILTDGIEI
jgi:predicted nucleotidyltransferase